MHKLFGPFNHLKLKYKLILFISITALATLLFFSLISVPNMKQQMVRNEQIKAQENIKTFQFFFDTNLNNMLTGLYSAFSKPSLVQWYSVAEEEKSGTLTPQERLNIHNDCYGIMNELLRSFPYISSIYLLDRQNNAFSANADVSPFAIASFAALPIAQRATQQAGRFVWELSAAKGDPTGILLSKAVYDIQNGTFLGYFVILLDTRLLSPFISMSHINQGTYYVTTEEICWNSPSAARLPSSAPKTDYTVTLPDPVTQWHFSYSVPQDVLFAPITQIVKTFYTASFFSAGLIAVLSLFFSNIFSRRLQELLACVKQVERDESLDVVFNDPYRDEIGVLSRSFNDMLGSLKNSMNMQRENVFRSFLEGTFDPASLEETQTMLHLNLSTGTYQVVLLSFGAEKKELPRHWKKTVEQNIPDGLIHLLLRPNLLCLISLLSEADTAEVTKNLLNVLESQLKFKDCRAFFGSRYRDIQLIKKSLEDAIVLLNYRTQNNKQQLYCYDNLTFSQKTDGYPHMLELKLMQSIEARNLDACTKLLREITAYFVENENEVYYASFFLSSIYLKLYKNLMDNSMHPEMLYGDRWRAVLESYSNSFDVFAGFQTLYQDIKLYFNHLNHILQNISITGNELIQKALLIIATEYHTPNLSITYLSDKLNISEKYFSALFKKEVGSGFNDYLTNYRMEKGKELLCNSRQKIKDISACVGFEYSHYFCSVFKQATGVTPTEFRKLSANHPS